MRCSYSPTENELDMVSSIVCSQSKYDPLYAIIGRHKRQSDIIIWAC